jgi:hypothetical protein
VYRVPISFHKRLLRGETPLTYVTIDTHFGKRAYAEKEMSGVFEGTGVILDGSFLLDGSETLGAGSIGYMEKSARLLSHGSFERTIQPEKDDIMTAYSRKQLQHISIELDNADGYFARIIPREPFLGRPISVYVGFEDEPPSDHLRPFAGIISELSVLSVMTIEADER